MFAVIGTGGGAQFCSLFSNRIHPLTNRTQSRLNHQRTDVVAAAAVDSTILPDFLRNYDLQRVSYQRQTSSSVHSMCLSIIGDINRRSIVARCGNLLVSFDGRTGICHIQQRGYRSTTIRPTVGQRKKPKSDSSWFGFAAGEFSSKSGIGQILKRKSDETDATDPKEMNDVEKTVIGIRENLEKYPAVHEQTAFLDGYLLSHRQKSTKSTITNDSIEKVSKTKRIRNYIIFLICLYVVMNAIIILVSGKSIKRFFVFDKEIQPEDISVTFDDVRGMDEAKHELQEIVDYLQHPERYSKLGGRLPKGCLLVGPPGTGKTLLARAIAGEAHVPFFHSSGSEFDEMLVGQGARRVRDLFASAKARSPCVVFIDEIDSVGGKRVTSQLHPYANQTVNQLLTEMDGFRRNEGVIVIGATNRIEDLDKALLRPGRFDVQVNVAIPDLIGRREIFDLYLKQVVTGDDLDTVALAKRTTGFTGADIESVVNQAALRAASDGSTYISMAHFDEARDRVMMGPARLKGRLPDEEVNKCTAYHEAGHTLVALFTKDAMPVHKVTIIPRGRTLGHTASMAEKDQYQETKSMMLASLDVLMGGRAAEELYYGSERVTTGAANDLKMATQLATAMVKQCGFSEKVGLRDCTPQDRSGLIVANEFSEATSQLIDQEINRLLNEAYLRAKSILQKHQKEWERLAEALLEYETLDVEEVRTVISGQPIGTNRPGRSNLPPPPDDSQTSSVNVIKVVKTDGGDVLVTTPLMQQ